MTSRKQNVEELLVDLKSLRRAMTFRIAGSTTIPRITPSQWSVLMFIEDRGESKVKETANALGITSSATTQLIDGLVTSGYVTRKTDAKDRRVVTIALSKKSRAQVNKMKGQAIRKFLKFFDVLNDKEFNQYFALNKKIIRKSLA